MRLVDLDPRWVGAGGEGVYHRGPNGDLIPAPERHGVAITFRCPCGTHQRDDEYDTDRVVVEFNNPLDGGPPHDPRPAARWDRTGDTFETLTIRPSIQRIGGCGWHGYITNGEAATC